MRFRGRSSWGTAGRAVAAAALRSSAEGTAIWSAIAASAGVWVPSELRLPFHDVSLYGIVVAQTVQSRDHAPKQPQPIEQLCSNMLS